MIVQGPKDVNAYDKIFVQMENGDTSLAIARGDFVTFDYTDNTAVPGISESTLGLRVVPSVAGGGNSPRFDMCGCAEEAAPKAAVGRRGKVFLVQVFGFHDAAKYDRNGVIAGLGWIRSSLTRGVGLGEDLSGATPGTEPERTAARCGISMGAETGVANQPAIIRCM